MAIYFTSDSHILHTRPIIHNSCCGGCLYYKQHKVTLSDNIGFCKKRIAMKEWHAFVWSDIQTDCPWYGTKALFDKLR